MVGTRPTAYRFGNSETARAVDTIFKSLIIVCIGRLYKSCYGTRATGAHCMDRLEYSSIFTQFEV